MNKTLLCFYLLLLVISLTACESNMQNLSSTPPENGQETTELNPTSGVTAASTTEPTMPTSTQESHIVESSPVPTQESRIVESSPIPTQESNKSTPTPSQNSITNEKAESSPAVETTNLPDTKPNTKMEDDTMIDLVINVGDKSFAAKLFDNASTQALIAQMPITLDMSEMNGNEKYYFLSSNLPTASERVGSIHTGELMLYGSDCLVLFYKDFQTSYSYTKLGYVVDILGLADALGGNGIQVTFSILGT